MVASVSLSVVGIFFSETINLTLETAGGFTVASVMATAKGQAATGKLPNVSAFSYLDNDGMIKAFSATYKAGFTSKGGKQYPAGQYFLAEDLTDSPAYTVWQYYVFNAAGVEINYKRIPFSDPQVIVPPGGSVVWRLVSILSGPSPAPRRVESFL